MTIPLLPVIYDDGYDFMEQLSDGWYVAPAWGSDGWDAGSWPLVILVHYDGDNEVASLCQIRKPPTRVKLHDV